MSDITLARKPVVLPDLQAEIARLRAENEALRAARTRTITCKVSDKGALSIYGLGRFPITLYLSQFDKLVTSWELIAKFVEDHRSEFSTKA